MNILVGTRSNGSKRVATVFEKASRTKRSFRNECDINLIMAKYERSGLIEHAKAYPGSYGDFTAIQDYDESLRQVMAAQESFNALPSRIRSRFENDPGQFVAFVSDPANLDEMRSMGLAKPVVAAVSESSAASEQLPT